MLTYLSKPFAGWNRNFALLATAVFAVGAFFGIQATLYNNFVVDRFGLEANQLGAIEALRETPGFMNVLFIALMIRVAPPLVAAVALAVMGVGIAAYGGVTTVTALGASSVLWSLGFHCWSPLQQTMALKFSPDGDKGKWLGQLSSINSAAWLVSIGFCMLTLQALRYEGLFVVAGVVMAMGGITLLFASRQKPVIQEKGLVFRRRYWLYYVLNLLEGCRRQVLRYLCHLRLGQNPRHADRDDDDPGSHQSNCADADRSLDGTPGGPLRRTRNAQHKLHRSDFPYFPGMPWSSTGPRCTRSIVLTT